VANVVKIEVTAADRASAALKGIRANIDALGGRMTSLGATALKAAGALGAIGVAAGAAFAVTGVKGAADFERALAQSVGLASLLPEEVGKVRDELLKMATAVGKGPQELAEAFYFASSAGLDTEKALAAVASSAKAAAAGMGETKVIVDAVTSVMNAYGMAADQAARVTDALVNTVKYGKGEPEDLAGSIGKVVPVASQMGVSIEEVGASMAVMTRIGLDAEESATALRGTLLAILNPAAQSSDALKKIGKSAAGLRQEIKTKGLAATLVDMMKALEGDDEALAAIIPEARALTGVLATAGNQSEEYVRVLAEMNNGLGATDDAFAEASNTFSFKMAQLKASFDVLRIKVGNELLPALKKVADWLVSVQPKIEAFGREVRERLTPALQGLGRWIESDVMPALQKLGDWNAAELMPRLERFTNWLGTILPGVAAVGGQTLSDIGAALGTLKDAAAALADWASENGEKVTLLLIGIGVALAWANPTMGIAAGIIGIALAIELMRTNSESLPKPLLEVQLAILGVTSAVVNQLETFADIGKTFSRVSRVLVSAMPEPVRSVALAFGDIATAAGASADTVEEATNDMAKAVDDKMMTAQAQLNSINFREAEQALGDLKTKGDLLPQTFASMADTGVASMVTLNQMTTAPIRGDIDKLTSGAHIAKTAAKDMVNAWDQALRDSTADFQAIARQIDEQSRRLQSLPWTPPSRPAVGIPSGTRSISGVGVYAEGGVVPGPLGKAQWGLLHGGEQVIPAGQRGEATVNNLQMHVTINGTSEEALTKFERLFNDLLRRAGYGGSSVSAGAFIPA